MLWLLFHIVWHVIQFSLVCRLILFGQIELPEVTQEVFLALLEYLYTDHSPIEDSDSVGILVLSNQYGLPRLINLCELYITKQVDKACAKSIADADIDMIGNYNN